jgi:predicted dehydrogenase
MDSLSPLVDCGVHYVDMMCLMSRARPLRVHALGVRLSDEIAPHMYNYGQLQVQFDDGSVGWFEAGWGPMISDSGLFVKDVTGPRGCAGIMMHDRISDRDADPRTGRHPHPRPHTIRVHYATLAADAGFAHADECIDITDEPDHDELCRREQRYFARAIREDLDLESHMSDAINSLKIVLAADRSVRYGGVVEL